MKKITEALIIAGGLGTRISHLSDGRPKSMMEISGLPFIVWQLNWLKKNGIKRVVISTGFLSEQLKSYFDQNIQFGIDVDLVREEEMLGTGGAIIFSSKKIQNQNFFCLNGDSICNCSLQEFGSEYFLSNSTAGIIAVEKSDVRRYGSLDVHNGYLTGFIEKGLKSGIGLVNAGVYAFNKNIFSGMAIRNMSIEKEIFPQLLSETKILVHKVAGDFIDIGTPESLLDASNFMKENCDLF